MITFTNEADVFAQEISDDELEAVYGGRGGAVTLCGLNGRACDNNAHENCVRNYNRDINFGGFPNCAATVEEDSWCSSNDACVFDDVRYTNMDSCNKAWD